jgi:hypothetical protein
MTKELKGCNGCGEPSEKLKFFYNAYGTKQGEKKYCKECIKEMEYDDNEALNDYMFGKYKRL